MHGIMVDVCVCVVTSINMSLWTIVELHRRSVEEKTGKSSAAWLSNRSLVVG
jgi:hypothetical protein